jgi:MYXO-CTERM domain-containing protein
LRCLAVVAALAGVAAACVERSPAATGSVRASPAPRTVAAPPLGIEENRGQWDGRVLYGARAGGLSLFLTEEGTTLVRDGAAVTMRLIGQRPCRPVARRRLAGSSSYLIGNDSARWVSGVPAFERVTCEEVREGVDMVLRGAGGALEYDLVVAPGASARTLEVAFDGADRVRVDGDGSLVVEAGGVTFTERPPRALQRIGGEAVSVASGYRVTGATSAAFDLGAYDETRELLIDPVLAYSTYLGGSGSDYAYAVAVDAAGAIYVTGFTSSPDFPTAPSNAPYQAALRGVDDVFVTKLVPGGSGFRLAYSTFVGGSLGSYARGLAVDATGAVYVAGSTNSADFPTANALQPSIGGQSDAFVLKLAPDGTALTYSTFLGGSQNDYGYGIAIDASGSAYVVGSTDGSGPTTGTDGAIGPGFPLVHAVQPSFGGVTDAFLAKLDASGSALTYSTYLGGAMDDEGRGVAVDASGAAYVTGYTSSLDFPTGAEGDAATPFQSLNGGDQNAFVTKLVPDGSAFAYSTFLGGSEVDQAHAIAVDGAGAAYVTGLATSPDFPTMSAYQSQIGSVTGGSSAFVTKLAPSGTALSYSTFLGGSGQDSGEAIAVDGAGEAFVAGSTTSANFPVVNAAQAAYGAVGNAGGSNAFVAGLLANGGDAGAPLFSTYLGGSIGDLAEGVAVSGTGVGASVYVAGYTASPDFPTVAALQPALRSEGGDNAFVAVLAATAVVADASVHRGALEAGPADAAAPNGSGDAAEPGPPDAGSGIPLAAGDGCSCRAGARPRDGLAGLAALVALAAITVRRRYR